MENVVLIVHLILALCLVGVVLLQRSEGGGLGMGSSGGGGGGVMSGRQAATALAKLTWIFAACFIGTSVALTVFAARNAGGNSVIDAISTLDDTTPNGAPAAPLAPGADLLPPATTDAPATTPEPAPRAD